MPDNFFTNKVHIRATYTFRVTYLVSAILWFAITEAGRFVYRPHVYSNDI